MASENAVELMSQAEFESYLAAKYGEGCYALKIARAEAGRVKATLRLRTPAVTPVDQPRQDDLNVLGIRWRSGEKISALAREAGWVWNKLWVELDKLGYRPQRA
jgi:hypothetical protein